MLGLGGFRGEMESVGEEIQMGPRLHTLCSSASMAATLTLLACATELFLVIFVPLLTTTRSKLFPPLLYINSYHRPRLRDSLLPRPRRRAKSLLRQFRHEPGCGPVRRARAQLFLMDEPHRLQQVRIFSCLKED